MLELISQVTIGAAKVPGICEIAIDKNQKELFSKAELSFPSIAGVNLDTFKKGDTVEIKLGYKSSGLYDEFTGYIDKISPNLPLVISCLGSGYNLKEISVNKKFTGVKISDIVRELCPDAKIDDTEDTVNELDFVDKKLPEVLIELKEKGNRDIFFYKDKLHFVKKQFTDGCQLTSYDFGNNIINSDLTYIVAKPGRVRVISRSSKETIMIDHGSGDPIFKVKKTGLSLADLQKTAKEIYEERNFEGLEGSFTAFGYPYTNFCSKIEISGGTKESNGIFAITAVKVTFGSAGYRRILYPGRKL